MYAKGYNLFKYNGQNFNCYKASSVSVWNVTKVEAISQLFLIQFIIEIILSICETIVNGF